MTPDQAKSDEGVMSKVYLVDGGNDGIRADEIGRKLKRSIPELRRAPRIEAIGEPALRGAERSFVLVIAPSTIGDFFATLIERAARSSGNQFFIAIGGHISATEYKRLLQTGNADWVAESGVPDEINEIVRRVTASAADARASERPIVVSFVPSAGGVGNSTLAIETAVQLAGRRGASRKVALVDLDFGSSHICDYLDIPPKFRLEEIIGAPERLDDQLMSVFASRHSSGLDVFAASRNRFQRRDLGVDALSSLFDRMAERYGYIIVDLPLSLHAWTVPLLTASEGILVTGVNTIPGLRQIAETLRELREQLAVAADVRAVVNKCQFGLIGNVTRADHVARILGDAKRLFVRNTRAALECVNVGAPMTIAYPSDKSVKDIAALADYCLGLKPQAPAALTRPAEREEIKAVGAPAMPRVA